jgi:hypothetical protein
MPAGRGHGDEPAGPRPEPCLARAPAAGLRRPSRGKLRRRLPRQVRCRALNATAWPGVLRPKRPSHLDLHPGRLRALGRRQRVGRRVDKAAVPVQLELGGWRLGRGHRQRVLHHGVLFVGVRQPRQQAGVRADLQAGCRLEDLVVKQPGEHDLQERPCGVVGGGERAGAQSACAAPGRGACQPCKKQGADARCAAHPPLPRAPAPLPPVGLGARPRAPAALRARPRARSRGAMPTVKKTLPAGYTPVESPTL